MKIEFEVKTGSKIVKHECDALTLDHGLNQLSLKLNASISIDRSVHNTDGTMSLKSTLFFGQGVKDPAIITVKI